jgi:hypothetical protein
MKKSSSYRAGNTLDSDGLVSFGLEVFLRSIGVEFSSFLRGAA